MDNLATTSTVQEATSNMDTESAMFSQLRVTIVSSYQGIETDDDRYVVYVLEVEDFVHGQFWRIERRYNQFRQLHASVAGKYGNICEFPPKKIINRFSTQFIDKRLRDLQEYLDTLMNYQAIATSTELKSFLDPNKNVTPKLSSLMWSNPTKEGLLTKQGHFMKTWRQRWFILQDNLLFYFKANPSVSEESTQPKGIITLGFCTVEPVQLSGRPNCFEIKTSDWDRDGKDFVIQATSEDEMKSWIAAIRSAKMSNKKSTRNPSEGAKEEITKRLSSDEDTLSKSLSSRSLQEYANTGLGSVRASKRMPVNFDIVTFFNEQQSYFKEPDTVDNIRFLNVNGRQGIRGGTLNKLLEKLTDASATDIHFIRSFLLTYRSFTEPKALLDTLIEIFLFYMNPMATAETPLNSVQLRISIVIRQWLGVHFYDFVEDVELTNSLINFNEKYLRSSTNDELRKIGKSIKIAIKNKVYPVKVDETFLLEDAPASILPSFFDKNFDFIDISPIELARQLCIYEFKLFATIEPKDFLNVNHKAMSPVLLQVSKRFNKMSFWAATLILSCKELKTRTAMLTRFIEVATECKKLSNFNSLFAICACFQNSAIHRLKKTWEALSPEAQTMYNTIVEATSPEKSFKRYREFITNVEGPCVPYLGVMMSDLTFIEEGNPDFLKDTNLINFEKRMLISRVILEIQHLQQLDYCLRPVPELQSYISKLDSLSDEELYNASLVLEPRENKNP